MAGYVATAVRARFGAFDMDMRDLLAACLVIFPSYFNVIIMKAVVTGNCFPLPSLANTCFVTQICRDIGMAVVPSKKNLH